ncbi:MAG: acetyl-CoA carboxylase carboxyl transferase subunit alpha/beta [Candidatus Adiutrix sp.]|jgi:acetyl-CoA carboxylase carboxyl transferase beta subunit|nr:acetyl-CoA carboxylase carboxyl transferase subunit alpha/beta [Candidatus Adiutrix sp.]
MSNETDVVEIFRRRTRSPLRPRASDLIHAIFPTFRQGPQSSGTLILGETDQWERNLFIIAQQKPKPENLRTREDLAKLNHGMLTAEDHSNIIRFIQKAMSRREQGVPVTIITLIDTYGADISMESARRFQAFFIAQLIKVFLTVPIPTVSVVIGEGGSGGALAIQMTDHRAQFDDALYATAPPESLAAIIFRDATKVREALQISKPTAAELLEFGVIDKVLRAPEKVSDVAGYAKVLGAYLKKTVEKLDPGKMKKLIRARRKRAVAFGLTPREIPEEETSRKSRWASWFSLTPLRRKSVPSPDIKTFSASDLGMEPDREWGDLVDPANHPDAFVKCGELSLKGGGQQEGCGAVIPLSQFMDNHYVCPECGRSSIMGALGWIKCLSDEDSFQELNRDLTVHDILHPALLTPEYSAFIAKQSQRSPFREALVTGEATIYGHKVALAVCEFYFSGGTLGVVFGEKFYRLVEYAIGKKLPLVSLCCSGGARLHEGTPALMQMVKTVNAVTRLKREGLPFISILGDPATGGAIASYAALGDVILAEHDALVIFTGPRVMEARGFTVNEDDVRAASLCQASRFIYDDLPFYYDIRGIQETASRAELKQRVVKYVEYFKSVQPVSNRYWLKQK